jgi:endo-1,4-beta-xylanase
LTFLTLVAVLILVGTCGIESASASEANEIIDSAPTFRNEFAGRFLIGAALSKSQIMGNEIDLLDFVARQFNALTAENEIKWERIHPAKRCLHERSMTSARRFLTRWLFTGSHGEWFLSIPFHVAVRR